MEMKGEFARMISQKKEMAEEEKGSLIHVLAVDDSVIDRKLLERLLTLSSYQVTCVDSVNKALEYLGLVDSLDENDSTSSSSSSFPCPSSSQSSQQEVPGSKVNLIMTDYSMPGMSGYDLLKRVKESFWKDVPVVVMSSENVPSRINMCLEGGAEEFLLKPVKLSDLRKLPTLLNSLSQSINVNDVGFVHDKLPDDIENTSCIINNGNKRKAVSPQPSERRPKLKELPLA